MRWANAVRGVVAMLSRAVDFGLAGTREQKFGSTTTEDDMTASSYGVTTGVVGLV